MNFADLATGDAVFMDANVLTYHFEAHARWGSACTQLLHSSAVHVIDAARVVCVPGSRYDPTTDRRAFSGT